MSLHGAYDHSNIFARIISGEIPAAKIYEDANVLAFMDAFPQTRGHALVISKTSQARNILEIEREALAHVMATTQRVARAINTALKPDGLIVKQFNGGAAGQTVFHLHVHVIPVWQEQASVDHATHEVGADTLKNLAKKITAGLR